MEDDAINKNVTRILALGYSREHAIAASVLRLTLIEGISKLKRLDHPTAAATTEAAHLSEVFANEININLSSAGRLPERLLLNYDLLPLWKEFSEALRQSAAHGVVINLSVQNVTLTNEIMSILHPALATVSFNVLGFSDNGLGRDGTKFLAELLETNPFINILSLERNEIEYGPETLSLIEAARKHTRLQLLGLDQCGIGEKLTAWPEIVPALLHLRSVSLAGNSIGSNGSNLVSSYLSTNPGLKRLYLDDNMLNDEDAILFASSLKSNTNLLRLSLRGNNFTDAGIKSLYKAIYDNQSLNSIHDSNHTCWLKLFADGQPVPIGIHEEVTALNGKQLNYNSIPKSAIKRCKEVAKRDTAIASEILLSDARKKIKILFALQGSNGQFNSHYLDQVPLELMPRLLVFFQESGEYAGIEEKELDTAFQIIRSGPLVFHAISAGPSPHGISRMKIIAALIIAAAILVPKFVCRQWASWFCRDQDTCPVQPATVSRTIMLPPEYFI